MFTKQETFDRVVGGILEQGALSADGSWDCKYRIQKNGRTLKCAAGQLIADEVYKPRWEGVSIAPVRPGITNTEVGEIATEIRAAIADHDLSLVYELQKAHDDSPCVHPCNDEVMIREFKRLAKLVAERHHLEWKFD